MMAALLWYRPGARLSKIGATTTTPASLAARPSASVLGPGTVSARSKSARVLLLAEVGRAEQLGQADDLRARLRCASATRATALRQVLVGVGGHRHLHEPDVDHAISSHRFESTPAVT